MLLAVGRIPSSLIVFGVSVMAGALSGSSVTLAFLL